MKVLSILCCSLLSRLLFGQHTLSGNVTNEANQAIEFVNVSLVDEDDNTIIYSTATNAEGLYHLKDIEQGTYLLSFYSFVYITHSVNSIKIKEDKSIDAVLKEEEIEVLDAIVVKSKRPIIRQTAEKMIVDIENSTMVNTNLSDVMRRVPGMIVTNDGLSYAGRSDIRILINGKTTEYMDVESLLRDFPADQIAKVELIEQPGAEFDAEGSGPIVNIILKKNVKLGTYGSLNAWAGEDNGIEHGASVSMASYKNKLNWQANTGYSAPTWREDLYIRRYVGNDIYDQATFSPFKPIAKWLGGSLDYTINKKHSVGFNSRYYHRDSERTSESRTTITKNNISKLLNSKNDTDGTRKNFNINPYYEYDDEINNLKLDFNYIYYNSNNSERIYATNDNMVDINGLKYKTQGIFNIKTTKLDYKRNINDGLSLRLGGKYSIVDTDNTLDSYQYNTENNTYEYLTEASNQFIIDEEILAFYTKANVKLKDWTFSGGLRYEYSNTKGNSVNNRSVRERKISKLFPSFALTKKITEPLSANLAYSYRIKRPSYSTLNSFVQYYDPLSAEVGNPNLKPSFTHNLRFNLTYEGQPFFTLAHSTTKDYIFSLISQNDETAQIQRSAINLSDRKNWSFRLFGPLSFINQLDGFTGFLIDYNQFKSKNLEPTLNLNKWSYAWYTQLSYVLPLEISLEASSYFSTGILQDQLDFDWIGNLDLSLGKKFIDDKLHISISLDKILSRGYEGTLDYNNISGNIKSIDSRRNIQIKLNYTFGKKYNKKKIDQTINEEENRINAED